MYNKVLDIFKAAADSGSFSKAAEKCFLSHTAIIKQINQLEAKLGVRLFIRGSHGVKLNAAGENFYQETLKIMEFSDAAIRRTQEVFYASPQYLLLGTSSLYPCREFLKLWEGIKQEYPNFHLKVVPFTDGNKFREMNDKYDFVIGAFGSSSLQRTYQFIPLGEYRFCLAMSIEHPLARKSRVSLTELAGETLMVMEAGDSPANDNIRQIIRQHYPLIAIEDVTQHYDLALFNDCVNSGHLLLSLDCWSDVHPLMTTVPLAEEFLLPYGIICAKNLTESLSALIRIVQHNTSNT